MLSGIGPAAELARHGIPVVLDAPGVGSNLAEHPNANMSWDVNQHTYNMDANGPRMALALLRWLASRRGPATSPYPHAVAFLKSSPDVVSPDIQLMFGPFAFAFSPEGVVPYRSPAVTVVAALNYPRARGRLTLRSADPLAPPVIDHQLLGHPDDVDTADQRLPDRAHYHGSAGDGGDRPFENACPAPPASATATGKRI